MQQQQQQADYDLLAVFNDEEHADAAFAKLRKEGFGDDEAFQLPAGAAGKGEFRVHGPSSERRDYFLQTQRSGPNWALLITLAIVLGAIIGVLGFVSSFAVSAIPEPTTGIIGIVLGVIIGAAIGLTRRRVRGEIGQNLARANTAKVDSSPKTNQGALTVVALRFQDPDNISRKSRARAILINNQGKIDRSVGRRE